MSHIIYQIQHTEYEKGGKKLRDSTIASGTYDMLQTKMSEYKKTLKDAGHELKDVRKKEFSSIVGTKLHTYRIVFA